MRSSSGVRGDVPAVEAAKLTIDADGPALTLGTPLTRINLRGGRHV
jgi:hypothetical protein